MPYTIPSAQQSRRPRSALLGDADLLERRNIIHFATAKKHIGLYPGPDAVEAFAESLTEYKTSKGAIQLPNNRDLPLQLIADIARWSYETNKK